MLPSYALKPHEVFSLVNRGIITRPDPIKAAQDAAEVKRQIYGLRTRGKNKLPPEELKRRAKVNLLAWRKANPDKVQEYARKEQQLRKEGKRFA